MVKIEDISKNDIVELSIKILKEIANRKKNGEMNFSISPNTGSEAYKKLWSEIEKELDSDIIDILIKSNKDLVRNKIAMAIEEDKETVSSNFARAPFFAIIENGKVNFLENEYKDNDDDVGVSVIEFLEGKDINKIIAGNFSKDVLNSIENKKIIYKTYKGKLDSLIGNEEMEKESISLEDVKKLIKDRNYSEAHTVLHKLFKEATDSEEREKIAELHLQVENHIDKKLNTNVDNETITNLKLDILKKKSKILDRLMETVDNE